MTEVSHTFTIGLTPKRHPLDIADFRAILSDLRVLPFVSSVLVDDESEPVLNAGMAEVYFLEVDITAAKDEQRICYQEICEAIRRHSSYDLVDDNSVPDRE